jgi:hypothetical protein
MVKYIEFDTDRLKENSIRIIEFLNKNNITKTRDLERLLNQQFEINEKTKEHIAIEMRPSNFGSLVYDISYIQQGAGILIDIKINKEFDYTSFIIKGKFLLPDYQRFALDARDNIIQSKNINTASMKRIRQELKNLQNTNADI